MALKQKKLARSFSPFLDTKEPLQKIFQEPPTKIPPHYLNPQHLVAHQINKPDPKFSFLLKTRYGKKVLHIQKAEDALQAMNRQKLFQKAKIVEKPSSLVHFNLKALANLIIFDNEALVTRYCNLRAHHLQRSLPKENQNSTFFARTSSKTFKIQSVRSITPCLKLMSNIKNMTLLIRHNETSLERFQDILSYHKSIEILNLQFSNKMNWNAFISFACSFKAGKTRAAYLSFLSELSSFKYLSELNLQFNFKALKEFAVLKETNLILNQLNIENYNIKLLLSFFTPNFFMSSHLKSILQKADLICLDLANLGNFSDLLDEKILSSCLQKKQLLKQNSKRTVDIILNTKFSLKNLDLISLLNHCQALRKLFIILPEDLLNCSLGSELQGSSILEEVVIFPLDVSGFQQKQRNQLNSEKHQIPKIKSKMGQYEEEYHQNYPEFNEEDFYDYCPEPLPTNEIEKHPLHENNNYEAEYYDNYPEFFEEEFYDYCPEPTTDYQSEIEAQYEQEYFQLHGDQSEEYPVIESKKLLLSYLLASFKALSSLKSLCIFYSKSSSQKNSLAAITDELVGYESLEKLELHTSEGYDIISMRRMLGSMMRLRTFEFHFYGSEKRFRWDVGFPFNDMFGILQVKIKINKGVKFMPWDMRFAQGIGKLKTLEAIEIVDETENVMNEEIFKTMETELFKIKSLRKVFLKMRVQKGVRSKLNVFRYQL